MEPGGSILNLEAERQTAAGRHALRLYLALYAVGRFMVTFLRQDKVWALGLQEAHFIAILVLAVTIPLLVIKARPTTLSSRLPRLKRLRSGAPGGYRAPSAGGVNDKADY